MKTTRIAKLTGVALAAGFLSLLPLEASAQAQYELNIGSLAPKGTPWMDQLEQIEAQVEAESGGRINVILRPPGVMGEVEMVRETRKGERLQGCGVTTAAIAEGGNIPQLSIVELPFLFDTNVRNISRRDASPSEQSSIFGPQLQVASIPAPTEKARSPRALTRVRVEHKVLSLIF